MCHERGQWVFVLGVWVQGNWRGWWVFSQGMVAFVSRGIVAGLVLVSRWVSWDIWGGGV